MNDFKIIECPYRAEQYNVVAEIKIKKRLIRKDKKIKYLLIGCQKFSEQTVEELIGAATYIQNIDMGNERILTQDRLFDIYNWFRNL